MQLSDTMVHAHKVQVLVNTASEEFMMQLVIVEEHNWNTNEKLAPLWFSLRTTTFVFVASVMRS